jgi:hypothetical protein
MIEWSRGGLTLQRTRGEALREWGREGRDREQRKWAEHWQTLEPQLSMEQKEKILKTVVVLNDKVQRELVEKAPKLRSLD